MTDLEKALEWADGFTKYGNPEVVILAAAYRAEKERADKAEKELKDIQQTIHRNVSKWVDDSPSPRLEEGEWS